MRAKVLNASASFGQHEKHREGAAADCPGHAEQRRP
jgi:hypothetical protein